MHIAYGHKQSAAPKQLYQEAHLEGFQVDLLLHPFYSDLLAKISTTYFISAPVLGRALPRPVKTAGLLVYVQLIGQPKHGRIWVISHGHNLLLPPAFASSSPFATQGKESGSGHDQTAFTGKRKGKPVVALLPACALNSYPILLDLTDGTTHHMRQLTGTSLICWTNLMLQQAYYKQAEWLARPDAAQHKHILDSIQEVDGAPLKKMHSCRPEAAALAQLSPNSERSVTC